MGGGGGVESSFSEKLLSSKQAFQYLRATKRIVYDIGISYMPTDHCYGLPLFYF